LHHRANRAQMKPGLSSTADETRGAAHVAETNVDPKPFVWTADPKRVLAAVKRGKQTLESVH